MSYEYTDEHGDSLQVKSVLEEEFLVKVGHGSGRVAGISIPDEYAPAVALAILEAAGVTPSIGSHPDTTPEEFESAAAFYLREAINKRSKQAEREAEDAKVREWRKADQEARGVNPEAFPWENLPPNERASWSSRYRAAREFFAKEDTPAPRVLQYGDPEPDRGTKWRDTAGDLFQWNEEHRAWTGGVRCWDWRTLGPGIFPMTEVTGDASR